MVVNKNGSTVTIPVDPIVRSDHQACVVRSRRATKKTATRPAAKASSPSVSPAPVLGTCVSLLPTVPVVFLVEVTLPLAPVDVPPDEALVAAGFALAVAAADVDCADVLLPELLAFVRSAGATVPLVFEVVVASAAAVVGVMVGAGLVGTAVGGRVAVGTLVGSGVSVGGTGGIAASLCDSRIGGFHRRVLRRNLRTLALLAKEDGGDHDQA